MSKRSRRKKQKRKSEAVIIFSDLGVSTVEANGRQTFKEGRAPFPNTFNWSDEGDVFVPRLLTDDERPDITSEAIRELINNTAKGEVTPDHLIKRLSEEPLNAIFDGIREGIHRWHTRGKEQR